MQLRCLYAVHACSILVSVSPHMPLAPQENDWRVALSVICHRGGLSAVGDVGVFMLSMHAVS